MQSKYYLGLFILGLGFAQSDPALRLGPFQNLQKAGALEALVELPPNSTTEAKNFQLIEDGRRTAQGTSIKAFRQSNWKASFIVALDVSRSLNKRDFVEIKNATSAFISQLKDPVALIAFADAPEILATFDTPRDRAVASLLQLELTGHQTHLYDAIDQGLRLFEGRAAPERQRIIVISDGSEESSTGPDSIDWVLKKAARRRVAIDTIWIPTTTAGARNTLVRATERTEGLHVDAHHASEIAQALKQFVARVDSSFIISFDRKVDPVALTKEVGIRDNRSGFSSAGIPLQIAASAPERSWLDFFHSTFGYVGDIKTLWELLGGAAAATGLYFGTFFVIKAYYPQNLIYFPKALTGIVKPTPKTKHFTTPPVTTKEPRKATGPSGRRTIVEHPGEPGIPNGIVLEAVAGPLEGTRIPVGPGTFRIGADPDSELALTSDDYVSSQHARIDWEGRQWVVVDVGSRNGTLLDDTKLERGVPEVLQAGQVLRIGASHFRVVAEGQSSAAHANARPDRAGSEPAPR